MYHWQPLKCAPLCPLRAFYQTVVMWFHSRGTIVKRVPLKIINIAAHQPFEKFTRVTSPQHCTYICLCWSFALQWELVRKKKLPSRSQMGFLPPIQKVLFPWFYEEEKHIKQSFLPIYSRWATKMQRLAVFRNRGDLVARTILSAEYVFKGTAMTSWLSLFCVFLSLFLLTCWLKWK